MVVHPPVEPRHPAYRDQPAPTRRSCGTQKWPLTAASFRTWRIRRLLPRRTQSSTPL